MSLDNYVYKLATYMMAHVPWFYV